MGAPKGNRFWEIRSKHGRDVLFESPEKLWEAAVEYFEWCEENPLIEIDFKGQMASQVELPKMRVYTSEGLCGYLGCDTSYFRQFKIQCADSQKDFITVIRRIEDTIRNQKFTGAVAGFLNPMLIARDLGLRDASDIKHEGLPEGPMRLEIVEPNDED